MMRPRPWKASNVRCWPVWGFLPPTRPVWEAMNDPDPSPRQGHARRRGGLFGLIDFFRGAAEVASDEHPQPLTESGGELVTQARAFGDVRVVDVMKPRADIVGIEKTCTFAEVVERFVEAEHSRMPV